MLYNWDNLYNSVEKSIEFIETFTGYVSLCQIIISSYILQKSECNSKVQNLFYLHCIKWNMV